MVGSDKKAFQGCASVQILDLKVGIVRLSAELKIHYGGECGKNKKVTNFVKIKTIC